MIQTSKNIAIIGSGLVGSLLAIYLKRRGHLVTVFDRRPDIRNIEFSGRSINLAMSNRGWKTLREIGIENEIAVHKISPLNYRILIRYLRAGELKSLRNLSGSLILMAVYDYCYSRIEKLTVWSTT